MEFKKGMSEGELMEALMDGLSCEQAFMFGQIMGIMSKGDKMHIRRLEQENSKLREEIVLLTDEG